MNTDSIVLSAYGRLIRALDNAGSVEDIFDCVSALTHQIIPANRTSITTLQPDRKTVEVRALYDDTENRLLGPGSQFTIEGDSSEYIKQALSPKIWRTHDKPNNHPAVDLIGLGVKSVMNVPLHAHRQFIGTLNLGSRTRIFQSDDLLEFQQIAVLTELSLNRITDATYTKATSRRISLYAQHLECLNDLGEQLLQVNNLEQALEKTTHCVNHLVGARRVSFVTLEPDGQMVKIKALIGKSTDIPGQLISLEDSGLYDSLIKGKAQYIPDLSKAQHRAHRSLGNSGLSHLWAFPIKQGKLITGVLTVATPKTELASEEATAILGTLARLLEATFERVTNDSKNTDESTVPERQYRIDALTGLPNRDVFRDHVDYWIKHCQRAGGGFGILLIDMDRFKDFNHSYGHRTGDRVLVSLTKRMVHLLRSSDFLARIGGDEFMVLLPMTTTPQHLEATARRVLETLTAPIELETDSTSMKASIGICRYPEDGQSATDLIQNADIAMYRAKELGGSTFESFTHELTYRLSQKTRLEQHLRNAVKNNEFTLVFQPVVDAKNKKIKSIEALIRWNHPDDGLIPPGTFIPIAESNGTIEHITDWVLESGLATVSSLRSQYSGLRVAINLSATEFSDKNSLYDRVVNALKKTGTTPDMLELELTETALLNHPEESSVLVRKLRDLGVRIALDDFGTGYASLTYLVDLPINTIKVDRSFVNNVNHDLRKQVVVNSIVAMAKSLELTCIAEGIETDEQRQWIQEAGCNFLQGYLISKPIDEESLRKFLAQYNTTTTDSAEKIP